LQGRGSGGARTLAPGLRCRRLLPQWVSPERGGLRRDSLRSGQLQGGVASRRRPRIAAAPGGAHGGWARTAAAGPPPAMPWRGWPLLNLPCRAQGECLYFHQGLDRCVAPRGNTRRAPQLISIIATSAVALLVSLACCACCARRAAAAPPRRASRFGGGLGRGPSPDSSEGADADGARPPRHCPTPVRALLPTKRYSLTAAPGAGGAAPERCSLCSQGFEDGQAVT
jgi:hypothetical protein